MPHFIRVLPVTNSGPVITSTGRDDAAAMGDSGLLTIQPAVKILMEKAGLADYNDAKAILIKYGSVRKAMDVLAG